MPKYLTSNNGLAGLSHSLQLLEAVIDNMAVFPEPPAPYKTKGLFESPVFSKTEIDNLNNA